MGSPELLIDNYSANKYVFFGGNCPITPIGRANDANIKSIVCMHASNWNCRDSSAISRNSKSNWNRHSLPSKIFNDALQQWIQNRRVSKTSGMLIIIIMNYKRCLFVQVQTGYNLSKDFCLIHNNSKYTSIWYLDNENTRISLNYYSYTQK